MTNDSIQRYTVSGDIAYPINEDPEGDYVTYEDHVAAIEADRKRRGEPVPKGWKLVPETPTSKQIVHMACQIKGADADGWFRTDGDDWPEHVDAAERAYKWALSEAPQPAEPVVVGHGETRANIGLEVETGSDLGGVVDHGEVEQVKVPSDAREALWEAYETLRELEKEIVLDVNQISGAAAASFAANRVRTLLARYSQPDEPVEVDAEASVPSDTDIDELSREWGLQSAAYPSKSMVRDFARALLARYTTTKEQP